VIDAAGGVLSVEATRIVTGWRYVSRTTYAGVRWRAATSWLTAMTIGAGQQHKVVNNDNNQQQQQQQQQQQRE
jgi:transcription initiation factor TFIID subunit TAF12